MSMRGYLGTSQHARWAFAAGLVLSTGCDRADRVPVPDRNGFVEMAGRLQSIDLSQMPMDGDGLYILVDESGASRTVHLASGESNCDRGAIEFPEDLAPGARIRVRGKWQGHAIHICEPGTWISAEATH